MNFMLSPMGVCYVYVCGAMCVYIYLYTIYLVETSTLILLLYTCDMQGTGSWETLPQRGGACCRIQGP